MAKCTFFDKRDLSFMSHTLKTSKFKTRWLANERRYWIGKLSTDEDLVPLMPDDDKTFSDSLVLDLRIYWRYMYTLYNVFNFNFTKTSTLTVHITAVAPARSNSHRKVNSVQ